MDSVFTQLTGVLRWLLRQIVARPAVAKPSPTAPKPWSASP
jgi:hypothetical protein